MTNFQIAKDIADLLLPEGGELNAAVSLLNANNYKGIARILRAYPVDVQSEFWSMYLKAIEIPNNEAGCVFYWPTKSNPERLLIFPDIKNPAVAA